VCPHEPPHASAGVVAVPRGQGLTSQDERTRVVVGCAHRIPCALGGNGSDVGPVDISVSADTFHERRRMVALRSGRDLLDRLAVERLARAGRHHLPVRRDVTRMHGEPFAPREAITQGVDFLWVRDRNQSARPHQRGLPKLPRLRRRVGRVQGTFPNAGADQRSSVRRPMRRPTERIARRSSKCHRSRRERGTP
jgi:hypothetical protein